MKSRNFLVALIVVLGLMHGSFVMAHYDGPGYEKMDPVQGLAQLSDAELPAAIKTWVRQRMEKHGFQGLRPAEKTLIRVWRVETALQLGGLAELFTGPAGDELPSTLEALTLVGAHDVRTIIEEGLKLFPLGLPKDRPSRIKQIKAWPKSKWEAAARLDDRYYASAELLTGHIIKFSKTNSSQFSRR